MKRHIFNPGRTLTTLAAVGLGSALILGVASGQPAGGGPGAGPGGGMGGGPGSGGGRGGGGRGNFQMRGGFLNLDDQQRQLFREALAKEREATAKLDEQLQAAEKALLQATLTEKFDDKVVAQKADAVAKIQSELMVIRARAFAEVAPTLKPEQRQELEDSRMGAMLLTSGMMNFMAGQGGGGGGGRVGLGGGGRMRNQPGGGGGGGGAGGAVPAVPPGATPPPSR